MYCPACKEPPLFTVEYDGLEVDCCPQCEGLWLDEGELALLFDDAAALKQYLDTMLAPAAVREKPRRCPVCQGTMGKGQTASATPVVYDYCGAGHGIWFDRNELKSFLKQDAPALQGGVVTQWLGAMFPESVENPQAQQTRE